MHKEKAFDLARFSAEVIEEAIAEMARLVPEERELSYAALTVAENSSTSWSFDDFDEWLSAYRSARDVSVAQVSAYWEALGDTRYDISVILSYWTERVDHRFTGRTHVRVSAPSRPEIERVFHVFERRAAEGTVARPPPPEPPPPPPPPKPVVFLGHGHSDAWRKLKDHLSDQQGYDVEAYETGARAGHTVRDIVDELLTSSTMAFLVMTGEDETGDGRMRARQNVVHEVGLFQGRLGFARAVAVVEEGVEVFSNLDGVHQIRFPPGQIRAAFGEVVATIRREFPD